MKKFKYPLAIEGTEDQLKALISKLNELGYEWGERAKDDFSPCEYNRLITDYDKVGYLGYFYDSFGRLKVSIDNTELILALAAMVDDDKFYKGEAVVYIDDSYQNFTNEGVYFVKEDGEMRVRVVKDDQGDPNGWHRSKFRKATYLEIVNHFKKNTNTMTTSSIAQNEQKEVIGYKFKTGFEHYEYAAVKIVQIECDNKYATKFAALQTQNSFDKNEILFQSHSLSKRLLDKAGVLDLWFEPVYKKEQPKFKVGDWVYDNVGGRVLKVLRTDTSDAIELSKQGWTYKTQLRHATQQEIDAQITTVTMQCQDESFDLQVSKKGIYYAREKVYLNVDDLRALLDKNNKHIQFPHKVRFNNSHNTTGTFYNFTYTHIDAGCKKNTLVSEWVEVLSLYDSLQ